VLVNLHGALAIGLGDQLGLAPPAGQAWAPLLDSEELRYGGRGGARLTMRAATDPVFEMSGPGAVVLSTANQRL